MVNQGRDVTDYGADLRGCCGRPILSMLRDACVKGELGTAAAVWFCTAFRGMCSCLPCEAVR